MDHIWGLYGSELVPIFINRLFSTAFFSSPRVHCAHTYCSSSESLCCLCHQLCMEASLLTNKIVTFCTVQTSGCGLMQGEGSS